MKIAHAAKASIEDLEKITDLNRLRRILDVFMLTLIVLHLPVAAFLVPIGFGTYWMGGLGGLAITAIAVAGFFLFRGTVFLRVLNGAVLMLFSILFIQLRLGEIEMHFHIFGALAFLLIYRDWRAIAPAALLIAIHHAGFNYCQQEQITFWGIQPLVFNYGSGWDIVFLHAIFVVFESAILIYYALGLERQFHFQTSMIHRLEEEQKTKNELIAEIESVASGMVESSDKVKEMIDGLHDSTQNQASTLEEMASGMEQVSASIDNIAQNAQIESSTLGDIDGYMEEMTGSAEEVSREIGAADSIVKNTTDHARKGDESLKEMIRSMDSIGSRSGEMLGIIGIINEIADRVNLLSLNASIEAARAGDAGRGFAVVAEEVSRLADQTASSITDINNLIKQTIEEIDKGKTIVNENSSIITSIIEDIGGINTTMGRVKHSMENQMSVYGKVQDNTRTAANRSKENSTATEELRSAINEVVKSISSVSELTQNEVNFSENLNQVATGNKQTADSLKEKVMALKGG